MDGVGGIDDLRLDLQHLVDPRGRAEARGSITNIAVTMKTANRICIAYCNEAIIAPTCITP